MGFESLTGRHARSAVALLGAALTSGCFAPHLRHLDHVDDVERVLEKQRTRDGVRDKLGVPGMADTPALYVYDWEKAKVFLIGSTTLLPIGHTGTRALVVFDVDGRVVRSEIQGAGQGETRDTGWDAVHLPQATAAPPPSKDCGAKGASGGWFVGPERRLVLRVAHGIRVCDTEGANVLRDVAEIDLGLALSPDGRLAATWNRDGSLTLRDGATFEPLHELEPALETDVPWSRRDLAIGFSADGSRVAAHFGDRGVAVYDTATGHAVRRFAERYDPQLSPDGTILVSKAETGLYVTEVDGGRDGAARPLPKYPYGVAESAAEKRRLNAHLGATAFSADGRRVAVATCAHAEVWDLGTVMSSAWARGLEDAFLLPFSSAFGVCAATVAFSGDGRTLAVANEKTVTLYDLVDHKILGAYGLPAVALRTSFTPDLARAVSVTSGRPLLWDVGKATPPVAADAPASRSADP